MRYAISTVTVICLSHGLACVAQGAEEQPTIQLEEIIVTAQKREQLLLDVPLSVSAFIGDALERTGADRLADFLQTAPGVSLVDSQNGLQNISIRGIASTFGDSPVGYYLDEVSFSLIANTAVPDVRTFDVERVEVLRGPQGTLYGDGSLGGVVRVLTRNPDLHDLATTVDLTSSATTDSDTASWDAKASVNLPVVEEKVALRIVGTMSREGGWIDHLGTGQEDFNDRDVDTYRMKLRLAPIEALDIVLGVWHLEGTSVGASSLENRTKLQPALDREDEYDIYSLTAEYDFGAVSLVSASSIMTWSDSVVGTQGGFPFVGTNEQDLIQEELRLASNDEGRFRWTAGFYYREIERDSNVQLFGLSINQYSDSKAWAVFGEGTWGFLDDKLEATVGLRYFEDERSRFDLPDVLGVIDSRFDSLSPRLNLLYRFRDSWMIYGNVSKGFRSGQIQPIVSVLTAQSLGFEVPIGIDAEELWSYEIGLKGSALKNRLTFEGAVYYNDWRDLQLSQILDPVVGLSALHNAGNAGVLGAELAMTARVLDDLTLQLSASVNDAEYRDDLTAANIQSGQRIVNVPKATWSASAVHARSIRGELSAFARVGVQHNSERRNDSSSALPSGEITTVDARIGLETARWGAYLFGDNLTDEADAVAPFLPSALGEATRLRPRTVGLNLRFDF